MTITRTLGAMLVLTALLSSTGASWAASSFEPIEIRLVVQDPGDGQVLPVEGSSSTLAVAPEMLLGPADFKSVGDVKWTEGRPGFDVALTPAGAEKLERLSAANVGRTLAIIVDSRIVMAPKILDPVRAQGFLLTVTGEAEARELAAKVRQAVAPE